MSFLLALCLMLPGVCEVAGLDRLQDIVAHEEAIAAQEEEGPVERWRPLVAAFFPTSEVDTALCIVRHESNGDPEADNPRSSASGLFQVLGSLWAPHYGVSRTELYDPMTNIRIARDIWEDHGWWAWSPYKRGACR